MSAISRFADAVTTWVQTNLSVITGGFKDGITRVVLDSVEALLVQSPWWLTCAVVLALAAHPGRPACGDHGGDLPGAPDRHRAVVRRDGHAGRDPRRDGHRDGRSASSSGCGWAAAPAPTG